MENNLKKEFSKRDVQRMRNIITGNTGDKTQLQAGWEKHKLTHKEGDVWTESGKQWTIKNNIKQTITKLDNIKQLTYMPLACPRCSGVMKLIELEKKMWSIHKMCFNCVIEMEGKIKIQGKWAEYESSVMNANKNASLDDLESALEDWLVENNTFVTEAGEVESWNGGDKKDIYKQVKEKIAELKQVDIYNKEKLE